MERDAIIIVSAATLAGAWMLAAYLRDNAATPDTTTETTDTTSDTGTTWAEDIVNTTTTLLGLWRPPTQYAQAIAAAEAKYGIPTDMLARLLYQESRYRDDIITGKTKSPVGALGIAQFMPATAAELGINPLDPYQAIDGAGRYLANLRKQVSTWAEALAAYNWGIGNVKRKGLDAAPRETRVYYASILGDINNSNGTAIA